MAKPAWQTGLWVSTTALLLLLTGCDGGGVQSQTSIIARGVNPLDHVMTEIVQQPDVASMALLFEGSPTAARYARTQGMTTTQPFRVASIAKVFTATVVLQLVEEGYFTLDTPLSRLLDNALLPAGYTLDDLHVMGNVKAGGAITIRQLLQHTAGLRDYIADSPTVQDSNGLFAQMITDVLNNDGRGIASRHWDGKALLGYYLTSGLGRNALSAPGQRFDYSDTDYLLLGLVVERVTGQSLTSNYRGRIFNRLGMANTWHEGFEANRGAVTHHFYNLAATGNNRNLDITATRLDLSAAWASGALVSTPDELAVFLRALMRGELFRDRATLALMKQISKVSPNYGLGLQRAVLNGREVWGHAGFWGTIMLHDANKDALLVMTVNQASRDMYQEAEKVFSAAASAGW